MQLQVATSSCPLNVCAANGLYLRREHGQENVKTFSTLILKLFLMTADQAVAQTMWKILKSKILSDRARGASTSPSPTANSLNFAIPSLSLQIFATAHAVRFDGQRQLLLRSSSIPYYGP